MKKSIFFVILTAMFLYNCGGSSSTESSGIENATEDKETINWDGEWSFSFDGGTNYGGTPIFIVYNLKIDGENVSFQADGYQTGCHLKCKGKENGSEFEVYYKSIDDLDVGCSDFDKTEPILVLTEKNGFLKIKSSQISFDEDIAKVVFENSNENSGEDNNSNNNSESDLANITDPIEYIRACFKIINASSYDVYNVETGDEGKSLTIYKDGNYVMKIIKDEFYTNGDMLFEYYFWEQELIFVYQKDEQHDLPMYNPNSKVIKTIENRYYFKDRKIIKWLDSNKNEIAKSKFSSKESQILEVYNDYHEYLLGGE